jgi:RNA polymerase subunit RPABC4/transcription elongation factor Spt4
MGKSQLIICKNFNKEHLIVNKYSCSGIFCSQKCQNEYKRKEKIYLWLNENAKIDNRQIKRYLLETKGNICYVCHITEWNNKHITLELEHLDGNSSNNHISNLELICPNCHSQTSTYKGANKGNGRHYRRLRYSQGKSY